jgi:hypothetical protein
MSRARVIDKEKSAQSGDRTVVHATDGSSARRVVRFERAKPSREYGVEQRQRVARLMVGAVVA